jgi:hypothetical protein
MDAESTLTSDGRLSALDGYVTILRLGRSSVTAGLYGRCRSKHCPLPKIDK